MIVIVLTAKFAGLLDKAPQGMVGETGKPLAYPAAGWNR
jgi:hypothetical protein